MTSDASSLSVIPAEVLDRFRESWNLSAAQPASGLLRLDLLRGLVRAVHAERSRCLAIGMRDEAAGLKTWELRLEELRLLSPLEDDLDSLLLSDDKGRKRRSRVPPQVLLGTIGTDRLNRYDRQWEAALCSEAYAVGWKFWTLNAWVEIPRAEEWNARLTSRLWPAGIVLFVETAPVSPRAQNVSRTSGPVPLPLWSGFWTLAVRPDLKELHAVLDDVKSWPGYPSAPPDPPTWKLLFAPKSA